MTARPVRRRVLITGGSSGVGLATAHAVHGDGHAVAILSRSPEALERASRELGSDAIAVPCDITDADAVTHAVATVIARLGGLDVVIHAAQTMAYGRIEDVPAEIFDAVVGTALSGTANLARAVLPHFRAQGRGHLVVVNSLLGEIATPRMGVYDSAKWGQLGLARVLQLETRDAPGIDVSIISLGAVDTPIYDQAANYTGSQAYPPPPVITAQRVARRIVRLLDRPRRHVGIGPTNLATKWFFRLLPAGFDAVIGPLVDRIVFRGGPAPDGDGNVRQAAPAAERERGGWNVLGRRPRSR